MLSKFIVNLQCLVTPPPLPPPKKRRKKGNWNTYTHEKKAIFYTLTFLLMYKESLGPLFTCLHVIIAKNFNVLKNIVPLTKALLKCGKQWISCCIKTG